MTETAPLVSIMVVAKAEDGTRIQNGSISALVVPERAEITLHASVPPASEPPFPNCKSPQVVVRTQKSRDDSAFSANSALDLSYGVATR